MNLQEKNPSDMGEAWIALEFYREIMQAMRSNGVKKILVTIDKHGKLQSKILKTEKPLRHQGP